MNGLLRHTSNIYKGLQSQAFPTENLDLLYSERSNDLLIEDNGDNAQLLFPVFKGNGSGYFQTSPTNLLTSDDWILEIVFEKNGEWSSRQGIWSKASSYFRYDSTFGRWDLQLYDGVNFRSKIITSSMLPIENRKYNLKIIHSKTGVTEIYESDNLITSVGGAFLNQPSGRNSIGTRGGFDIISSSTNMISCKMWSDTTETNLLADYILDGENIYDNSGNNNNLLSTNITSANKSYSVNGNQDRLNNGYQLYQKSGSNDIQMPINCTTVPSGYTLVKDRISSTTGINLGDCLIGFNESESADGKFEIFDRSNITIHNADSRSSQYYDSTNLATKSRFHISEIYPYENINALLNVDYQDRIFPKISKSNDDFSVIKCLIYSIKQTGGNLTRIKSYCKLDQKYTVGADKNFKTINAAIDYSFDDYTLTIDTGTYNEYVDLTGKRINLIGLGSLESIIYVDEVSGNILVDISKNANFTNILFNKREATAVTHGNIIKVDACTVNFTNCQIAKFESADSYTGQMPMSIINGGVVTMTGSIIESMNPSGKDCILSVADTSQFTFEGTKFEALVQASGSSIVNIDTDEWWYPTTTSLGGGLIAEDSSNVTIQINTKEVYINRNTNTAILDGTQPSTVRSLDDTVTLELSGNQIISGTVVNATATGVTIDFKNIISTYGRFWYVTNYLSYGTIATFDNCQIKLDTNNDVTGYHLIEDTGNNEVRILNNSILEFTGHNGNWFTMGQPVQVAKKIYMRDSLVIDNVNDNIPFGANYEHTISIEEEADIENCTITNQNWDGVGTNANLKIVKQAGKQIKIRLKDVIFNNSEINTSPIQILNATNPLEAGDYICEDNVTYNSSAANLGVQTGDPATIYTTLKAACPL